MAPPKKRALPEPLPEGFILTDTDKKKWRLGKIIGQGGFGLIYLASRDVDRPVAADAEFVVKVEYQENGPLFSELKFYQRAAKPESVEKWKRNRKLDFLGIPTYWASGLAEYNDLRYRFMAMDRLGSDLQKVLDKNGGRCKKAAVLQLGLGLVTALEYIHDNEYVHADIKAANLMLGHRDPDQVYLADYGLAYRYCPHGVHKEYKENPKKGHNGTIEYTSLDAHKGLAPSRRSDLQTLGFCLLHWLCGSLPWGNALKNPAQVQEAKARLMDNLPDSVQRLSVGGASTDEVAAFLLYVKTLQYQEKPDYRRLEAALGGAVAGRLDLSVPQRLKASASKPQNTPAGEKTVRQARAVPRDVDDEAEEAGMKCKLVPARRVRGPPLTRPQVRQEAGALPAGRSLRPRHEPVAYKECDTEDEEDDGEEEAAARPRPIPACYLRGPPIGPRTKQKTESKRTAKTTDRRGGRRHPHGGNSETRDGGSILHRAGYRRRRWWDRDPRYDSSGEWAGSPGQEATPTWQNRPFSWLVLAAVLLLLSVVFGVCQSAFLSKVRRQEHETHSGFLGRHFDSNGLKQKENQSVYSPY